MLTRPSVSKRMMLAALAASLAAGGCSSRVSSDELTTARRNLRIVEHFADFANRTARNAGVGEPLQPLGTRPTAQRAIQQRSKLVVVLNPVAIRLELRVRRE